ncbi:unnamed protein product, partial [Musa textilis]
MQKQLKITHHSCTKAKVPWRILHDYYCACQIPMHVYASCNGSTQVHSSASTKPDEEQQRLLLHACMLGIRHVGWRRGSTRRIATVLGVKLSDELRGRCIDAASAGVPLGLHLHNLHHVLGLRRQGGHFAAAGRHERASAATPESHLGEHKGRHPDKLHCHHGRPLADGLVLAPASHGSLLL